MSKATSMPVSNGLKKNVISTSGAINNAVLSGRRTLVDTDCAVLFLLSNNSEKEKTGKIKL